MRAVLIETPGSVRVDTWPDPVLPGTDGAVVQVSATAICGSDLHFYEGDYPLFAPVSLGHEAVGTVVEVGPDVRTVKVGDVVLVSSVAGCGGCKCSPEPAWRRRRCWESCSGWGGRHVSARRYRSCSRWP